jgi:hypothetical protein
MADKPIRVLRLIEYVYEDAEAMQDDMARWTHALNPSRRVKFRSTSLPPEVLQDVSFDDVK